MSMTAVRHVIENTAAKGTAWRVLVVLAERANDSTWECFPGIALIAKEAKCSPREVRRALDELQKLGEIVVTIQQGGAGTIPAYRRPNLYLIVRQTPRPEDHAPLPPRTMDPSPPGLCTPPPPDYGPLLTRSRTRSRTRSESKPASAFAERGLEGLSAEPNTLPSGSAVREVNGRGAGGEEPQGHTDATKKLGGRGPIFEALLAVCDFDGQPSENDQGRVGLATKDLREVALKAGMTHEEMAGEVAARAANYRQHWPGTPLTPQAITGMWCTCSSPPAPLAPKAPPQDSNGWGEYRAGLSDVRPAGASPHFEWFEAQRAASRVSADQSNISAPAAAIGALAAKLKARSA